tara:strand:- start:317 stop:1387 length:1071 start_codon:yes stop_codon:yes gene_type:complete
MRILFISRAFPPVIGGIEKQNFEILNALSTQAEVKSVVNPKGKKFLLPFVIIALYRAFRLRKDYDVILLGDGVLAVVAAIIRCFSRVPVICIVHGLDITYSNFIYRNCWLKTFFKNIDHFIAVGNETIRQAVNRGLPVEKFSFVPNGVDISLDYQPRNKKELAALLGFEPQGYCLLTLGRLVRRKGVLWFIENVMPALGSSVSYIIAGDGKDAGIIRQAIKDSGAAGKIVMLGNVSEADKDLLLSSVDIFVQPNIKVNGDMEGFGLVVLEAALHARPVIASRLEGLADAINDGENGILLESENTEQYVMSIQALLQDQALLKETGNTARDYVLENYSWKNIAEQYLQIIESVCRTS